MTNKYLETLLGVDSTSPESRRAFVLVNNSFNLIDDLIKIREERGLSRREVSEIMGVPLSDVEGFEAYDSNPTLSTIRRYAHAVGAVVSHTVEVDTAGEVPRPDADMQKSKQKCRNS